MITVSLDSETRALSEQKSKQYERACQNLQADLEGNCIMLTLTDYNPLFLWVTASANISGIDDLYPVLVYRVGF